MKKLRLFGLLLGALPAVAFAQGKFQIVTGKPFESALPKNFYLEGNAIPLQERNATMIQTAAGKRAVFALLDTTGYASSVQAKYAGMIISEGGLSICGQKVAAGSYGFGFAQPAQGDEGPGKLTVYDQAGDKLFECTAARDAKLQQPRPLQVVVKPDGTATLYNGRRGVELR